MGVGLTSWRAVTASVAGSGHRARGIGCEDASVVDVTDDGLVIVAVADGAGSAPRAAEGSARAVTAAMEALRTRAGVADALAAARSALEPTEEEAAAGVVLGHRATTLLLVRAGNGVLETAQVGDGAVVARRAGGLVVVGADARGEYLNETCFLTSPRWQEEARVDVVPLEDVDAVAVLTDGLQLVALDLATGAAHAPFFAPFFSFVAGGGDAERLATFLSSERVAARTDDDVTLAVAALVTAEDEDGGAPIGGAPRSP